MPFIVRLSTETRKEREGKRMRTYRSEAMRKAYETAGARERYAMENGNKTTIYVRGHKCFKFTYSVNLEYQDGNGATYDTITESWID